jgi:hypothetical protein
MGYRLHRDETIDAIWDSLPQQLSEQLTAAMADVLQDPFGTTEPFGVDDGMTRRLLVGLLAVTIYVGLDSGEVYVWEIEFLG